MKLIGEMEVSVDCMSVFSSFAKTGPCWEAAVHTYLRAANLIVFQCVN